MQKCSIHYQNKAEYLCNVKARNRGWQSAGKTISVDQLIDEFHLNTFTDLKSSNYTICHTKKQTKQKKNGEKKHVSVNQIFDFPSGESFNLTSPSILPHRLRSSDVMQCSACKSSFWNQWAVSKEWIIYNGCIYILCFMGNCNECCLHRKCTEAWAQAIMSCNEIHCLYWSEPAGGSVFAGGQGWWQRLLYAVGTVRFSVRVWDGMYSRHVERRGRDS